jgi:hypothetical protein
MYVGRYVGKEEEFVYYTNKQTKQTRLQNRMLYLPIN